MENRLNNFYKKKNKASIVLLILQIITFFIALVFSIVFFFMIKDVYLLFFTLIFIVSIVVKSKQFYNIIMAEDKINEGLSNNHRYGIQRPVKEKNEDEFDYDAYDEEYENEL